MQTAIVEAPVQQLEKGSENSIWVEAMPARIYKTPMYGEVKITPNRLERMIKNFKEGVRGQEIATDYDHKTDRAKGNVASGWFKDLTLKPSSSDPSSPSLFALIDFTEEAKKEIKEGKWKYFSLEWEDQWEDTDGNKYEDVITGGGLTNRPIAKKTLPINFSEAMWTELSDDDKKHFAVMALDRMAGESKEWEHSEPGTGSPPEPRTEEDGSDDPAIKEGWRRPTPPPQPDPEAKGGNKVGEYVFAEKDALELMKVLDLEHDTKPDKIVEAIRLKFGELDDLRKSQDASEQEKQFAEKYPEYWAEHNKLMERDRENTAKAFAESVKSVRKAEGNGLKTLDRGLSPVAKEKVINLHKKFSEGTAEVEDFEDCLKAIMNGGIIEFGEIGSSGEKDDIPIVDTNSANGIANARKVFSEIMKKKAQENPDWDNRKALEETAKEHPDLYAAYSVTLPG